MPKSRKRQQNPHGAQKRKAIRLAKAVHEIAAAIPDQDVLNDLLLDEPDPQQRHAMYRRLRPLLKFDSQFPTRLYAPPAGFEVGKPTIVDLSKNYGG